MNSSVVGFLKVTVRRLRPCFMASSVSLYFLVLSAGMSMVFAALMMIDSSFVSRSQITPKRCVSLSQLNRFSVCTSSFFAFIEMLAVSIAFGGFDFPIKLNMSAVPSGIGKKSFAS